LDFPHQSIGVLQCATIPTPGAPLLSLHAAAEECVMRQHRTSRDTALAG